MKFLISTCLSFLLFSTASTAQYAYVAWAKQFSGDDPDMFNNDSYSVAVDADGNVYSTGFFIGTRDFDPGPGQYNLASPNYASAFISKLDANGNFVWAQQISGTLNVIAKSLEVDLSGNIVLTGNFEGLVDFDPGPGTFNIDAGFSSDVFVMKLSGTGDLIWVKPLGQGTAYALAVDAEGNVISTGVGNGDFDPGAGVATITQGIYFSKLDNNGNFIWAKGITSEGAYPFGLTSDNLGNVYVGGGFTSTAIDADPGPAQFMLASSNPFANLTDAFIIRLDANGNFVWARSFGAPDASPEISALDTDPAGNLLVTGDFFGTVDFDPSSGTAWLSRTASPGAFFTPRDVFVGKYNALGELVWINQLGNQDYTEEAAGITTDILGNVYITGEFMGTSDFDPGTSVYELTASCSNDIFIQKLNPQGGFIWAKKSGGGGNDNPRDIAVDIAFNVYNTGKFQERAKFDNIELIGGLSFFTSYVQKLSETTTNLYSLSLGSKVWSDVNSNGLDDNEPGLAGVTVYLYEDEDNNNEPENCAIAITTTDAEGHYQFSNLRAGNYIVSIYLPETFAASAINGGDPDNNRDADNNGILFIQGNNELRGLSITLAENSEPSGNYNGTYDFGLQKGIFCLGNRIWNDLDNNGKDNGEPGLAGVEVNIYRVTNNNHQPALSDYLFTTLTDDDGYFSFCNLAPGEYILGVITPAGFTSSTVKGGDPDNRKDGDNNGVFTLDIETRGLAITLAEHPSSPDNSNNTYDFGFHALPEISGKSSTAAVDSKDFSMTMEVFPNPFVSTVNVTIHNNSTAKADIRLRDVNGKLISILSRQLVKGYNNIQVDKMDQLPAGIYLIELIAGDNIVRKRIVKL
jgi:hypothetical protein